MTAKFRKNNDNKSLMLLYVKNIYFQNVYSQTIGHTHVPIICQLLIFTYKIQL